MHTASAAAGRPERLLSLDVFRGLVVAAMILVTDPGTYSHRYGQLAHADWMGATATDMIFPAFLLMVGIAIPFSLSARTQAATPRVILLQRIARRTVTLFVLGLILNGLPSFELHTWRIPGILQRLAVCYLLSAVLYLYCKRAAVLAVIATGTLVVYWAILKLAPVPGIGSGQLDTYGNFPSYVDRAVFGVHHLWAYGTTAGRGVTYDSEGILSTIPALFTTIQGVLAGTWLRSPRPAARILQGIALSGAALAFTGYLLSPLMPLNKKLYTPTFALWSTGISLLVFAAVYSLIEMARVRRGLAPFLVLGTNAILAFTVSSVVTVLLALKLLLHSTDSIRNVVYKHLFAPHLPPNLASLFYALLVVAFNVVLIYPLYRRRIFLRL